MEGINRVEIGPTNEQRECDKYCNTIRGELVNNVIALAERNRTVKKLAEQNWDEINRRIRQLPNEVVMLIRNSEHPSTFTTEKRQQQVWEAVKGLVVDKIYRIDAGLDGPATSLSVIKDPKNSNPTQIPSLPGWMKRNMATLPEIYGEPTQIKIDDDNLEEVIRFKKPIPVDPASGRRQQKSALAQVDIFAKASQTKNNIFNEYQKVSKNIPSRSQKEYML